MKRQLFILVMVSIIWCGCKTTVLASSNQPVEEFVEKIFLHGVMFDNARELKSVANINILKAKLDTDCTRPQIAQESPFCSNIVVTLGIIGGDVTDAVKAMKRYIEKQQDTFSLPQFRAKTSGVIALGYAINKNPNTIARDIALDVLKTRLCKKDCEDVIGNQESVETASPPSKDELKDKLRRSSVIGLALSGSEEGREALEQVLEKSETKNDPPFQALVIEALNTLNTIITLDKAGKNGLSCYYNYDSPACQQDVLDQSNKKPYATFPTQG